jgi:hypothetical protein
MLAFAILRTTTALIVTLAAATLIVPLALAVAVTIAMPVAPAVALVPFVAEASTVMVFMPLLAVALSLTFV